MNDAAATPHDFQLDAASSPTIFLGLPIHERNRRVARRAGAVESTARGDRALPRLIVPRDTAVTPALFAALPAPQGIVALTWDDPGRPLLWVAPGLSAPSASTAPDRQQVLPAGAVLDVSTAPARYRSSWILLRASGKPADGWLSRHVHRRISRVFSYVFLQLGLSANMATFATFLLGAAAAWLMAQTSHVTMIAGGLLYWGASIADGIDGEMARLTLTESAFGEQLDTAVDQATHLLFLAGIGVGWWRQGLSTTGMLVGIAVAAGVPLVLLWGMALVRRASHSRQFFVVMKPIEFALARAARETGSLPLRAAAAIFILFRREAFSFASFAVALLTGMRVAYPALVGTSLLIVAATFLVYRAPLASALAAVTAPVRPPAPAGTADRRAAATTTPAPAAD